LINGGYMVCSREIFGYLPDDPGMMFEHEPIKRLTAEGKLGAYIHPGFWQPMDTLQELIFLNRQWEGGRAPWKVWDRIDGV
jgi:glucose-1-phosphate cytidylyltransferase